MPRDDIQFGDGNVSGGEGRGPSDIQRSNALTANLGASESEPRRRRAKDRATPTWSSPASAPIGGGDASGDEGAIRHAMPSERSPPFANTEIGQPPESRGGPLHDPKSGGGRGKRATPPAATSPSKPASQPIGPASDGETGGGGYGNVDTQKTYAPAASTPSSPRARGRKARNGATPAPESPSSQPHPVPDGSGGGQGHFDTHMLNAPAALPSPLPSLQRRRKFAIRQVNASVAAITQLIAQTMGYRIDASEKDRKATFARANAFRLAVEKGGEGLRDGDTQMDAALSPLIPYILTSAANRAAWVDLREKAEAEMIAEAKRLPFAAFVESVPGLGWLGAAVIQAEAGAPLAEYRTVSGLWKRMGVAVIDGRRQRRVRDKAEAERHGYSAERRAEVWAFLSDTMFRAQWNGARLRCACSEKPRRFEIKASGIVCKCGAVYTEAEADIIPAHPAGAYGEVYARRRAVTEPRIALTADLPGDDPLRWTPARVDKDARRVMSKALLRDLWRVSRGLPPRGSAPAEPHTHSLQPAEDPA